jgi:hypothetical protein
VREPPRHGLCHWSQQRRPGGQCFGESIGEWRAESAVAVAGFVEVAGSESVVGQEIEEVALGFGPDRFHEVEGE